MVTEPIGLSGGPTTMDSHTASACQRIVGVEGRPALPEQRLPSPTRLRVFVSPPVGRCLNLTYVLVWNNPSRLRSSNYRGLSVSVSSTAALILHGVSLLQ